nr:PREDICTED: serine/threonine-protein phosphatase 2A 55 kDa regulatory subunit B beta isoform [Opisthocomus hoazin]
MIPGFGNLMQDVLWCFSQVKGTIDIGVTEADIISTVEFNHTGELLATGDKGGRVVIFQREQESKHQPHRRGEYNVYSTFQSHEPEFDYLKSLEIEEKINKIRWLPQQNAAYFLLSTNDKTVKLWKVSERDKRPEGYNLKDEDGRLRDPSMITMLRVPVLRPMDLMVEATPRRVFANAHTYHINSISVNSDYETYMSADDLRINLWNFEITNQSFSILGVIMTGSYNNFFRMFDRNTKRDVTLEASRENSKPRAILKPRKVCVGGKRRKDEISVDSLDFSKKILHTAWHPSENIIAVAATNNLYIFQDKVN